MAINLTTPRGQGYLACLNGKPWQTNPHGLENIPGWYDWSDGWWQAYNEGKFGNEC